MVLCCSLFPRSYQKVVLNGCIFFSGEPRKWLYVVALFSVEYSESGFILLPLLQWNTQKVTEVVALFSVECSESEFK